jgi:hypothetical protein
MLGTIHGVPLFGKFAELRIARLSRPITGNQD